MRSIATAMLLGLSALGASAAGVVNVKFVDPDHFYDAANSKHDLQANLAIIERHLSDLGQRYLADGQVLDISVLDIDLAGYMKPLARSAREVRVTLGAADWPRFTVRYTLEANGVAIKSAEEVVADMNYGRHGQIDVYSARDPLRLEKQMLDNWFQARFRRED